MTGPLVAPRLLGRNTPTAGGIARIRTASIAVSAGPGNHGSTSRRMSDEALRAPRGDVFSAMLAALALLPSTATAAPTPIPVSD